MFFFFHHTTPTDIYPHGHTLSLHDALPISLLGVLDDGPGGAVLHRAAGVLELRLAEDLAAGLLRQLAQADEGGVADRADKTVADVHGSGFLAEVSGLRRRLRKGGGARPARLAAPAERVQGSAGRIPKTAR